MDAVKIKRLFHISVCLVLSLILGIIYQPAISWLVCAWLNNEYYNYGLLLLPVSTFLICHKRSEIYRTEPAVRHVIPLGVGFSLYVAGVFLHQPTLFCFSLLFVSAGFALLFLGSGAKPLLFPIFLFALAIPSWLPLRPLQMIAHAHQQWPAPLLPTREHSSRLPLL